MGGRGEVRKVSQLRVLPADIEVKFEAPPPESAGPHVSLYDPTEWH